jgi:hypothetical protein
MAAVEEREREKEREKAGAARFVATEWLAAACRPTDRQTDSGNNQPTLSPGFPDALYILIDNICTLSSRAERDPDPAGANSFPRDRELESSGREKSKNCGFGTGLVGIEF